MKKMNLGIVVSFIVLVLTGCTSTDNSAKRTSGPALVKQEFSKEELLKVASYKNLKSGILIDELQDTSTISDAYKFDANTMAYEGYRLLQLLGLDKQLGIKDQYIIIQAIFSNISKSGMANGAGIKNIIVSNWYDDKKPLVLNITKLMSKKEPMVVVFFNTHKGIRQLGGKIIRSLGPAFEYPRVIQEGDKSVVEADEYYAITILNDGRVSASGTINTKLSDFDKIEDAQDRVNLTDSYLRNGTREDDKRVVPVLMEVIHDESENKITRVHAYLQMFMYYLFNNDYSAAQEVIKEVKESLLLDDPKVSNTEIAVFAKTDLEKILKIARALDSGNIEGL